MAITSNLMQAAPNLGSSFKNGFGGADTEPYEVESTNWYKSLPYGFTFYDINSREDETPRSTMYLPIAPNNISVKTNYATNIVTTLYGIVEEHSEVRYYDIVIQGTTGFAPRFVKPFDATNSEHSSGRKSFVGGGIDLGGFLPEVTNVINQAMDIGNDISNTINGGPTNTTGISPQNSGYVAFHNLYKFFLKYKADAAQVGSSSAPSSSFMSIPSIGSGGQRKTHPLQFKNYKDGIQYDCIPINFTLTRTAEDPMLYNYRIELRCFNLRNVNDKAQEFTQLEKLGLGGLEGQSIFAKMTNTANNVATFISETL